MDFEVIGKIVVDETGAATLQGIGGSGGILDSIMGKTSLLSSVTSAFGDVARYVWANLVLDGVRNAIGAVQEFVSSSMQSAMESQDAIAELNAVIESTGSAAGWSADQAVALANSLQEVTRFSDETILSGQSMLLTFTQIGADIMPQATEALLDLAQKMGTDVQTAAIQLGKALNDPVDGVTALRRVGVALTDEMRDQIETFVEQGDILSAQKIILGELSTEFGGLARAMGETTAGQLAILNNRIDEFKELLGGPLLVALSQFKLSILGMVMDSEGFQFLEEFLTALNGLLQDGTPLWYALGATLRQFDDVVPIFEDIGIAFMEFQMALDLGFPLLQTFQIWLANLAMSDGPLAGLAQGLWEVANAFRTEGLLGAIDEFVTNITVGLADRITAWVDGGGGTELSLRIISFFENMFTGEGINSGLLSAMGQLAVAIGRAFLAIDWGGVLDSIDQAMANLVNRIDWAAVGDGLAAAAANLFDGDEMDALGTAMADGIESNGSPFLAAVGNAIQALLFAAFDVSNWDQFFEVTDQMVYDWLEHLRLQFIREMNALEIEITNDFRNAGRSMIQGLVDGLNSIEVSITDWVRDHIVTPFKQFLGIASPSALFRQMGIDIILGLIQGIGSIFGSLGAIMLGLGANMITSLISGFSNLAPTLLSVIRGIVTSVLGVFQPVLDVLNIDLGLGTSTGATSGYSPGGGLATGSGTTSDESGCHTLNFYGPVYVGSLDELTQYGCPTPHPIVEATQGNLTPASAR